MYPGGNFDGISTYMTMYKSPMFSTKNPLHLRTCSKTQYETMEPTTGKTDYQTQYQRDNPLLPYIIRRRCLCAPYPDKLQLFQGQFDPKSEHHSRYVQNWKVLPQPRTSFKGNQRASSSLINGEFDDRTTTNTHYQPVSKEAQFTGLQEVNEIASKVSFDNKNGQKLKDVQHFGGEFKDKTVNQSEYFQFWKVPPRIHYGDSTERIYHPSKDKFSGVSETKAQFLHHIMAKPAEQFQSLEARYNKSVPKYSEKMSDETAYKTDFIPRPLPQPQVCPAEMLLQKV